MSILTIRGVTLTVTYSTEDPNEIRLPFMSKNEQVLCYVKRLKQLGIIYDYMIVYPEDGDLKLFEPGTRKDISIEDI